MFENDEDLGMDEVTEDFFDNVEDVEGDEDYEDSDLEDVVENEEDQDADEEEDLEDSTEEPETETPQPLFDKKQQAEVNRIIKSRIDRYETTLVRDLSKAAGVEIAHDEIAPAARLWGLLKANPKLSKDVDGLIANALQMGAAKAPLDAANSVDAISQRLELKEAILDLKAEDTLFSKNADGILAWAENEGYEITNGKSLKLAYLAWKGTQGRVAEAIQKSTAKRKQATKKAMQKRATVQSAKPGARNSGKVDYRKMSDEAVLADAGLSLFTDD